MEIDKKSEVNCFCCTKSALLLTYSAVLSSFQQRLLRDQIQLISQVFTSSKFHISQVAKTAKKFACTMFRSAFAGYKNHNYSKLASNQWNDA